MDLDLKDVHVLVTGAVLQMTSPDAPDQFHRPMCRQVQAGGSASRPPSSIAVRPHCFVCFAVPSDHNLPALGAEVTAHYNTQYGPLESLSKDNVNLQAVQAELSDETSVTNMFTAIAHAGPVQVLIVNHGIWPTDDIPVADLTLERWNRTIATNLTSSFLVCREYLSRLRNATPKIKEKAAIVLIGSTAGKYGEAGHADYAVTKSGVSAAISRCAYITILSAMMYGLTMTLKNEIVKIAPKGRVNTVAPGWVRTPMAESALADPDVVYRALAT